MDNQLTEQIKAYLDAKPEDRNILHGAEMVLKLNRNKILYQNIVMKPQKFADKVVYELNKFYAMRMEQKTLEDVIQMDATIIPSAADIISKHESTAEEMVISSDNDKPQTGTVANGRRADHDELPDDIKALWDKNGDIYFKIKETFEELKKMNAAPACDRFERLNILSELDKSYRSNFAAYDSFKTDEQNFNEVPAGDTDPADIVKKVNAARTYLSKNKSKLAELKDSDPDGYAKLLAKVQEKYDYLVHSNNNVEQSQTDELAALGVVTVSTVSSPADSEAAVPTPGQEEAAPEITAENEQAN